MIVAFFDFDGTITTKDSFLEFIAFSKGRHSLYKGILRYTPSILAYKMGCLSGHKLKERFITYFYKDLSIEIFSKKATQFVTEYIETIVRPNAMARIKWHQEQGHKVVIVSGSLKHWIKPWCDRLDIDQIATDIEVKDGKITGLLSGKNCIGMEKVTRIKSLYDMSHFEYIYAYGNSNGDKELLELANEKFYRHF